MRRLIFTFLLSGSLAVQGQTLAEIDSVEKHYGARDYTWVQKENNIFKMRKAWTRKWGLFSWNDPQTMLLPMEYDSVSFMRGMEPISIVKKDGKYGRFLLPFEVQDAAKKVNCSYDRLILKTSEFDHYLLAQKNGRWALIDWFDEFEITPYQYKKPSEVPLLSLNSWEKELTKKMRDSLGVDLVEFDPINGDGVFRARHRVSKKWGLYQMGEELIPAQYDSLYFFKWNGLVTPVFQNGKVGMHLSPWSFEDAKETVPCIYDDYYFVVKETGGVRYLAVKKEGRWAWLDWLHNELKSPWQEGDPENLSYPYYEQER